MTGKGLLTHSGSIWKTRRKMFNPGFQFKVLRDCVENFNEGALSIVKQLDEVNGRSTKEVLPILKMGVLRIFCQSILGVNMNDEKHEEKLSQYVEMISSLGDYTMNRGFRPWLWSDHFMLLFPDGRKYLKMCKELRDFTRGMIREMMKPSTPVVHRRGSSESINSNFKSVRNILIENNLKDSSITMKDLEEEVCTFLFAGHDTTSYAMLWCLFMLGLHPEIQEKAFEEVQSATDNGVHISYNDFNKLKYLECIIKETLRLYPVVPIFMRETRKEIQCGKHTVPKNAIIVFTPYVLHRSPDIYPDPEKFDPERFYEKSLKHPWAYIPFSEGIRSCIGKNFAMMEMKIILAHILRNFKITSLNKREEIILDWKVVLTPMTPIYFKFSKRHP